MILLYERTFLVGNFRTALRRSWSLYVGLAAGWLPLMLLMLSGPATPETGFGLGVPAHVWWLTQAKVIFLYLNLAIWPWPLAIHYHIPYLETWAEGWPWLLAAMSLIIATGVLTWKRSGIGYALSWFFVVLSPTLVVPLVNAVAAERRMYVPLMALVALAMISLGTAWQRIAARFAQIRPRQIVAALAVLLLAELAAIYVQVDRLRLAAFASERVLWEDTAKYQPDDPLVQVNLGIALVQAGERRQAIEHLSGQFGLIQTHFAPITIWGERSRLKPSRPKPSSTIGRRWQSIQTMRHRTITWGDCYPASASSSKRWNIIARRLGLILT
jgi:hypothetical protein